MSFDASNVSHLQSSESFLPLWGIRVDARNRSTGLSEPFGIWQGDDDQTFTVNTGSQAFNGAQGGFVVSAINRTVGLNVQSMTVTLNGATPDSVQLVRGFDVRFRRADIYLFNLEPSTGNLIGAPTRMFKGYVNSAPLAVEAEGGLINYSLELVSHFRDLTNTPNLYKSDQDQKAAGDDFRQYGTMSNVADDPWGGR